MSSLLVNKTSQASNSEPGSFADMVDMSQSSVVVGSSSSIVLLIFSFSKPRLRLIQSTTAIHDSITFMHYGLLLEKAEM